MATSRGFGQFAKRMNKLSQIVDENAANAIRRAAVAADQAVVLATPVDTGRARANWVVAINSVDELLTPATDPSGAEALAKGRAVIEKWYLGAGPIFISNSLPYIIPLEEGHSKQAPAGMTKFAMAAARAELIRSKLLRE